MTTETAETGDSNGGRGGLATVRRVLTVLGALLLIAVVVPFVIFAVPQVVGADHGFVILSGSMEPALSPGDVVIVDESASVGVGDVVTFDDGKDIPTTHRVIGVENGQYVTQGDANENADGQPVPPGAVLGRVTLTIPLIGHVILWANTPVGYITLVLIPIGLLLVNELYSWAKTDGDADAAAVDAREAPSGSAAPTPAIRRVDAVAVPETTPGTASGGGPPADHPGSGTVMAIDVKLTALSTAALFAYALWNVSRDVAAGSAPNPVSVAAATAGLFGLLFAVSVMGSAWLSSRREGPSASDSPLEGSTETPLGSSEGRSSGAQTDGGRTDGEER